MCEILNKYFTKIVTVIKNYGGDIIKFAGDALVIVWHPKLVGINTRSLDVEPNDSTING